MKTTLNRLLIWQKLLIVGLIALVTICVPLGLYLAEVYTTYKETRLEVAGIGPALKVLTVLQDTQKHRGLSAQTVAGQQAAEAQRTAMQHNITQDIAQMEATFASVLDNAKIGPAWLTAVRAWEVLVRQVQVKSLTVEQSFQAHTALNGLWLDVLEHIRDEYRISLDPETSGYFLHLAALIAMPDLTEALGQARAKGTGLLAQGQATDADKAVIIALINQARDAHKLATRSIDKAFAANPTLSTRLAAGLNEVNGKVHEAFKLAEQQLVSASTFTFAATDYYAQYTATIDAAFDFTTVMTKELQTLLQARLSAQWATAGLLLGAVLVLMVIAGGIAYVISHSIATSASQLSEAVGKFAAGDDQARVQLTGSDELAQISTAFNHMVDERLGALQRENEALNNSIVVLIQAVGQLSQKDLTIKVPVAEDVTGVVADALNLLASETAEVLTEVTRISEHVATASRSVKAQADAVMSLADTEREQVTETAERLAAAADAMNDIAALAQTCNSAAETAISRTQTALDTVTHTVEGINTIRDTIRETEKRIKRLGERSQEIGGAVNLINGIAERTHILALNASMHAASAGEAGRGFAVVADEVQRLAENARQSTEQIAQLVNNIQTETMDTVTTMNTVISQVVEGSRLAGQAGEQMRQTQQSTSELVASVRQIATGAQTQARVSNQLRDRAGEIMDSTRKTSEQLVAQGGQTTRLLDYASRLVRAVRVFKLPNQRQAPVVNMVMDPEDEEAATLYMRMPEDTFPHEPAQV